MQYGYGVYFNDIQITRPLELVKKFPEDYTDFKEWMSGKGLEPDEEAVCIDEWLDNFYAGNGYYGFAPFFATRVGSAESIDFACEDRYGCVVFPENYPWAMTEKERSLTKQDVENIFRKWISLVTDDAPVIQSYAINPDCD